MTMPKVKKPEAERGNVVLKAKRKHVFAVGRRKRSVARVKLYQGQGQVTVNSQPVEEYFSGVVAKEEYLKPFRLVGGEGKYFAVVKVEGGGKSSQLGAFVHGVARAFEKIDKDGYRPILKKSGLLTRDPREKERRKPGYAQKARKKKQSPKR
jgi:small subunit ribosomal protein S9